jgi:hypothetical protein
LEDSINPIIVFSKTHFRVLRGVMSKQKLPEEKNNEISANKLIVFQDNKIRRALYLGE